MPRLGRLPVKMGKFRKKRQETDTCAAAPIWGYAHRQPRELYVAAAADSIAGDAIRGFPAKSCFWSPRFCRKTRTYRASLKAAKIAFAD
jgi:hypothetical protein